MPVPPVSGADNELISIAGTSPRNLWAAGNGGVKYGPLMLHWNGARWRRVAIPVGPGDGYLGAVTARSATDAWVVGEADGRVSGPLILHWDGSTWNKVPAPDLAGGDSLGSVTAISARNAWAVGGNSGRSQILHWNGSFWTQVPLPRLHSPQIVMSVSAGPDGTVWAAGFTKGQHHGALLLRWTGRAGQQSVARHRGPGNDDLAAIAVLSRRDVWAAGPFDGPQTVILHWNGTGWTRLTTPGTTFRGGLTDLAATSASDVWAAGYRGRLFAGVPQILHWNGSKWTRSYGPASTKGLFENGTCGPYSTICATHTP